MITITLPQPIALRVDFHVCIFCWSPEWFDTPNGWVCVGCDALHDWPIDFYEEM